MAEALTAAQVRGLRDAAPFTLVDSIRVGPTMGDITRGWFNTFQGLSRQQELSWFRGRDPGADGPWCNTTTERRDYAFKLYRLRVEFHTPIATRTFPTEPSDALAMPQFWATQLPQNIRLRLYIQGTDELLNVPAVSIPAGVGPAFGYSDGAAVGLNSPGTNGQPAMIGYVFPEPVDVPTNAQFYLTGLLDPLVKTMFNAYTTTPGTLVFPGPNPPPGDPPVTVEYPAIYSIRVYMDGQRAVQLRGARSAP